MPNLTDVKEVERLKNNEPFMMRAEIPMDSRFLGVVSIPSLVDMMGFSGGGGPPGYAFAVNPDLNDVENGLLKRIFVTVMPNTELPRPREDHAFEWVALGVAQCVGILLGHYEVVGRDVIDGSFEEEMESRGARLIDMIQYEPPPLLRSLYNPKMEESLGKKPEAEPAEES